MAFDFIYCCGTIHNSRSCPICRQHNDKLDVQTPTSASQPDGVTETPVATAEQPFPTQLDDVRITEVMTAEPNPPAQPDSVTETTVMTAAQTTPPQLDNVNNTTVLTVQPTPPAQPDNVTETTVMTAAQTTPPQLDNVNNTTVLTVHPTPPNQHNDVENTNVMTVNPNLRPQLDNVSETSVITEAQFPPSVNDQATISSTAEAQPYSSSENVARSQVHEQMDTAQSPSSSDSVPETFIEMFHGLRNQTTPDAPVSRGRHNFPIPIRPRGRLGGDMVRLGDDLYKLRVKIWPGLRCEACPEHMKLQDLDQHPSGYCQKHPSILTGNYYEVLLKMPLSSSPAFMSCEYCKHAGEEEMSETHSNNEHGMGRWYDHPDNDPIPDLYIHFYNPAPGLGSQYRGLTTRIDIPPLSLLKEPCNTPGEALTRNSKWQRSIEEGLKFSWSRTLWDHPHPDVLLISKRHEKCLSEKNRVGFFNLECSKDAIPPSDYTEGQDTLPSHDYLTYMLWFLGTAEENEANRLLDAYHTQKPNTSDPVVLSLRKKATRVQIVSDLMEILEAGEENVY